jgi:hypothetical protein
VSTIFDRDSAAEAPNSILDAGARVAEAAGLSVVERVRSALVQCALTAYEDAGARGLCSEGAWEAAIGAMRNLDLTGLTR